MSFWEINKKILSEHYARLLEELESEGGELISENEIKIETTQTGEPTLSVRGIYVHSQRDPAREGQRLFQAAASGNGPIVILGFGLGFTAQAAAKEAEGRPVIIVEKYKNLLLKAFELRDFSEFLSKNRIIFVVGGTGEAIAGALDIAHEFISANESATETDGKKHAPTVICNRALASLDEEWYKGVEDRIRTWSMRDDVNSATLKRFGRRWVRNLSRNMSAIRDLPGITCLEGLAEGREEDLPQTDTNQHEREEKREEDLPHAKYKRPTGRFCKEAKRRRPDKINALLESFRPHDTERAESAALPVFLAAAGPSLDKALPLLRDIYERCIIVAVDTSLRFFTKNGIQPDFVLVVDPQFWNSRHLDRCFDISSAPKTALIAESAVYPPVLRLPFKHSFLCGSLFPLGTFIENQVDPKGRLEAGGSVATSAWDFARVLGGAEIWIAGLDLAFPEMKTHFRGASFEERANAQSSRFNPVEKWVLRALRDGIPFKARSCTGGQVLTDRRLSLYAAWFENQFSQHKEVQNFALFQNGLEIKGLHAAKAEEFLALPKHREEIDCRIELAFSQIENDFREIENARAREQRYEKAVSSLKRGLESIKDAAERGASIARKSLERSISPDQQKKVLRDLDALTRRITESEVKEVAGFLFPSIEDDEKEQGGSEEKDPFRVYLKSSLKFFSGLAQATENAWK